MNLEQVSKTNDSDCDSNSDLDRCTKLDFTRCTCDVCGGSLNNESLYYFRTPQFHIHCYDKLFKDLVFHEYSE